MKILFVHDHIFSTKNGIAYSDKLPYTVLQRYVDVFGSITVLARNIEKQNLGDIPMSSGNGVEFVFLESISSIKSYFGLRQQQEKVIAKLISDHNGVIVRLPSEYGFMTAKIANKMKVQCAVEVVGCVWDALWNYGNLKSKIYAPMIFYKMKNTVKKSNNVLYVTSQFLQNRYPIALRARTTNVSNVELPNADDNILLSRLEKIKNKKGKLIFGTIGSMKTKYKGIHVAIKALSLLMNKFDNFEYHVLGGGVTDEYKALAEDLGIGDKVFFDGTLPSGDPILKWLENIDIYLQPSFQEGLPRTLLEAMSRGCPAIGSTAGGIPELLNNEMLFNPRIPKDMSKIILRLVNNKELMKEESIQNFETSKQYQKKHLDKKRKDFWLNVRGDIKEYELI